MNKIYHLFDEKYVKDLFARRILSKYPDFKSVKKIKISAPKKYIWETTYHVVIKFATTFITKEKKEKKLSIYCSAHSDEPRKNVYRSLKFLWDHGFGRGYLTIPHPLFYSNYFQGTFYRGVEGNNLYYYIRERDLTVIEEIIPKAAAWFAKLHKLPVSATINFNKKNSRIATAIPGIKHILERISENYPEHLSFFKKAYGIVNNREKEFLNGSPERWLTHGDAHPENVIKMGRKKLAVIDFTDLCLSDFARDLGAFSQQIEFMIKRKIKDKEYAEKTKKLFLDNYFAQSKIKSDKGLTERIDNYYYWTALRTAGYFLLKDEAEPERGNKLIKELKEKMKI